MSVAPKSLSKINPIDRIGIISSVIPPTPGGLTPQVSRLIEAIIEQRHWEVTVITQSDQAEAVGDLSANVVNCMPHWRVSAAYKLVRTIRQEKLSQVLIVWIPHAYEKRGVSFGVVWAVMALRLFGVRLQLLACEFAVKPTSLSSWLHSMIQRLSLWLLALGCQKTAIAVDSWRGWLAKRLFWKKDAIRFVPVGSTVPKFSFDGESLQRKRRDANIPNDARIVCTLNPFGAGRELEFSLAVWEQIAAKNPNDHLVFLGGELTPSIEKHLAKFQRVFVTGFVSERELSAWLQIADVYFANYDDGVSARRSSVMVAFEHGVATVVNRDKNTDPIWKNTPLELVDSSPNAFSVAIQELLDDEQRRKKCANKMRLCYEQEFSHAKFLSRLFDLPKGS